MSGSRGPIAGMEKVPLNYESGRPKPPNGLTKRGLEIFEKTCELLEESGFCTVADFGLVSRYCQNLADWERETAKLQSEGFVIETKPHGKMQRNPRGPVVKALEDSLLKAEKCLGFAPSERVRIRGERFSDPENDPLDEFRPKNPILERMNKSKRKTKDQ